MARKGKGKRPKKRSPGADGPRPAGTGDTGLGDGAADRDPDSAPRARPAPRPIGDGVSDAEHRLAEFIHNNVEMLAVAVIYALFIKFFVVEAFRIPSSSMEPTLIGSPYISDKILVAKNHYLFFHEPERLDVAVFKYPNNRSRAYIKRIVGMPGDWLMVRDGDAILAIPEGDGRDVTFRLEPVSRIDRPDEGGAVDRRVLDSMLYDLYPADAGLRGIHGLPARPIVDQFQSLWTRYPANAAYDLDASAQAVTSSVDRGTTDGEITEWIRFAGNVDTRLLSSRKDGRKGEVQSNGEIAVEDIVLAFDLSEADQARVEGGVLTVDAGNADEHPLEASFFVDGKLGTCGIAARRRSAEGTVSDLALPVTAALPPEIASAMAAGKRIRVRFDHIDFHVRLWLDDALVLELPYPIQRKCLQKDAVTVRFGCLGIARFEELYLARDIYYSSPAQSPVTSTLKEIGVLPPDAPSVEGVPVPGPFVNRPFLVPDGHYVLLGDNSFNSADSRHWHVCGYLEAGGQPRIWEDAGYALAGSDPKGGSNPPRFDIFGRTFTPRPEQALRQPREGGEPILLGHWVIDGQMRIGFHDEVAGEFVDIHGARTPVTRPTRFLNYVFLDQEGTTADPGGTRGGSFSVLSYGPPTYEDGVWTVGVHNPHAPNGLQLIRIPDDPEGRPDRAGPRYRVVETPHMVWSPFVSREQLLGKAFSVFLPGGFGAGGTRSVGRFKYIR